MNCKVVLLAAGAGTVARPEHRLVGLGAGCSWSQSAQMFSLNPLIHSQSAVTSMRMVKNSAGSAFTNSCWSCFFLFHTKRRDWWLTLFSIQLH